ncbi:hypothetical protein RYZ26_09610 [Terasakiella sp. A23]|uniref:hypothetical protein n=1 Tax=Terasakiella sp. FCG-A23 TaxID=3080561 RepID=UPI002953C473|nr:hypothetical protein [Terasakiella sp. A23]MDV7339849.1 hypothetical protein [Terasakiella sp. A23]
MYRTLSTSRKNRYTHPDAERRTSELAHLLVNAFGYKEAKEKARQSHWSEVAETIRFMESESLRRF